MVLRPFSFFLLCSIGQIWQVSATKAATNPLQKVMQMLSNMRQDIVKTGRTQQHAYEEFSHMCETRARELQHENKIASSEVEDLTATINKANDDESEADSKIEELSSQLSTSESDLKAASKIRNKEAGEFAENQSDLLETISQMERAISIIEKQVNGGASFAQMSQSVSNVQQQRAAVLTQALAAIVDASFIGSADASSLAAFMQTSEEDADGDAQLDAATESYSSVQKVQKNSASLLDTLQNLLEKAQSSLQAARTKETTSSHNFALFKGTLERKLEVDTKDMNDVKKEKAEAGQTRAEAQGDLEVAKATLAEGKTALSELHHECMTRASDFEDEVKSLDEEQKAVTQAVQVLKEMTGDAGKKAYGELDQVSFLQMRSRADAASMPTSMQVVQTLRQLGQRQNLQSLVQIAHKMEAQIRSSLVVGADPLQKVRNMLSDMTKKLVTQMQEEASHKVYCDKEMSETKKHKSVKEAAQEKLSTRIDMQTSRSMNLKRQVADIQKELVATLQTQKDTDRMRQQEHTAFKESKLTMEQGLKGVRTALKVLRDYYSQSDESSLIQDAEGSEGGSGSGVIGMLTVIESDFSKGLANLVAEEETAQLAYEAQTRENQKGKKIKEQDVIFKTKEAKSLDKATSESSADLDGVQTELDAVREYFGKIQEECVAKPDSYEERRKRQEQTMQGLRDALETLEGKAALVQSSIHMRGTLLRKGAEALSIADEGVG